MRLVLVLLALVMSASVHADQECDACIEGFCHTRRLLLQGLHITDQLAIDSTNNILYTQINGDTTIAFFIDEPKILTVQVANTTGLAVDQETQTLYSSDDSGIIFAHTFKEDGYYMEATFIQDRDTTPARLHYLNTLYTVNKDGSCGYFNKNTQEFTGYDNLKDYRVTDMANVKAITNWFFVSDGKPYRYAVSDDGVESWHLLSKNKYVLSVGKYADNYFSDATQKTIYKFDLQSMELKEYATYKTGSVKEFVFDRDEKIVFLDEDGNVAQWVPSSKRCTKPRHFQSHPIFDGEQQNYYIIMWILRKSGSSGSIDRSNSAKHRTIFSEVEDSDPTSQKDSREIEDPDSLPWKADEETRDSETEEYTDENISDTIIAPN